ncbi:hypothetical protein [Microbacterium oxydans]|uniref:hypothetical protein n=1 Tax=Microbacterium oxydans TaxID=82380 RepID=UPI001E2D1560|nr:hypothetical protein [Microbacterium oxydans]
MVQSRGVGVDALGDLRTAGADELRAEQQTPFVPLCACGRVALSLYLLHGGLIALWSNAYGRPAENFYLGWLVIVPGMIVAGWLWWRFVGTGPVEWVMGWLSGRPKTSLFRR